MALLERDHCIDATEQWNQLNYQYIYNSKVVDNTVHTCSVSMSLVVHHLHDSVMMSTVYGLSAQLQLKCPP